MTPQLSSWKLALTVLPIIFAVSQVCAQADVSIIDLDLVGNLNSQLMPGESIRIVVMATASGRGALRLKLRGRGIEAVSGWDAKTLDVGEMGQLVDTLFIRPTRRDYGRHSFTVLAEFFAEGTLVESRNRRVRFNVSPIMLPEPPYSKGAVNQLCWSPLDPDFRYELIKVFTARVNKAPQKGMSVTFAADTDSCDLAENLPEGPRWGYYVAARNLFTGLALKSNLVYSVQDQSPPPAVSVDHFSVAADGAVKLFWDKLPDAVSYIDRYVVYRKNVDTGEPFAAVDTLPVFPVTVSAPANYYPVAAAPGLSVYTDTADSIVVARIGKTFEITRLPAELQGTTLVKTALTDRWNESETPVRLNLSTESDVFIAYDVDRSTHSTPEWLTRGFSSLRKSLRLTLGSLQVFRSDQPYPAGPVVLGGNFARGTRLRKKQPLMYLIFVKPAHSGAATFGPEQVSYVDSLGPGSDQKTFKYQVAAFDAAGNRSTGPESPPIVIDLEGRCKPEITRWFAFEAPGGPRFNPGVTNDICVLDPAEDAACRGFRDTDSLRFQVVREAEALFDQHDASDVGRRFFDSGWLSVDAVAPSFCYTFNLLPTTEDPNFVNAKTYHYRVQGKDRHGNLSDWSDTRSAVQDAFPPDDITSLAVESERFAGGETGANRLSWGGASDLVSGIRSFVIYRSNSRQPDIFAAIDTVSGSSVSYRDSLSSFASNEIVTYKIGSIDNVGNERTAAASSRQVSIRALRGPDLRLDSTEVFACADGLERVVADSVSISWPGFDNTGVAGYEIQIRQPDGARASKYIFDRTADSAFCPLSMGDGNYRIRIRAFYSNRDTTIFSNTLKVRRKVRLAPVQNLRALQDPARTGNILLSWTHPDQGEIARYEIFTWADGEPRPATPSVVLPGDSTAWQQRFTETGLKAYQCNNYSVRATDCFGLVSELTNAASTYSNPPPVFATEATEIGADRIKVCWSRPAPRLQSADAFEALMLVYEDSLAGTALDSVRFFNDTCFVKHNPLPGHNYVFQVKESILSDLGQACGGSFESAPSSLLTVPFENRPGGVEFSVQPLPVPPGAQTGSVFLSWEDFRNPAVNRFIVKYSSVTPAGTLADSFVVEADTFLVANLDIGRTYEFSVIGIDSLGQRSVSGNKRHGGFSPRWSFTPKIAALEPGCFRDSLNALWTWIDENGVSLGAPPGADSIFAELSIDSTFSFKKTERRLAAAGQSYTFARNADFPFANAQDDRLFLRIRAKDRWGHISPWSSTYTELGIASARFDAVPPAIVESSVDSVKAPLFGSPAKVNVHLNWPAAPDNCSGTAIYEVTRNDSVIATVAAGAGNHKFVDRGLPAGQELLSNVWRIFSIDRLGNRQPVARPNSITLFVAAPDSAWCENDTTVCWTPAIASPHAGAPEYFVEGARFPALLGNAVTNVTAGPLKTQCFEFNVPWEGIYWRIKARVGKFESAWSDTFFCDLLATNPVAKLAAEQAKLPVTFALKQNFPNPFNPTTTIRYDVPAFNNEPISVALEVYNIRGHKVKTLVDEKQRPGEYAITWDGRNDAGQPVSSGVYVVRLRANDFVRSYKMTFLK